ncbi:MAG: Hpt domain-containing protein [Porticoccaceae bacterium]
MAEIYSLELIEKTEKIEEAITSEDINSVRELAHSLISSSHAVGLLQLSSSFQSIQELSKSGNIDQIKKKVLETVALKEKSLIALDEFLLIKVSNTDALALTAPITYGTNNTIRVNSSSLPRIMQKHRIHLAKCIDF